ncbi:uncharacterized protein LOC117903778 [Drosophila subobscura]|uniref:uncharacterized protein LOC117903778 n=1 Tax=Drosophila subobscura TaxID=7241 RepID=UPI00155B25D1|nr:uncharacterized protein LOC117903778 [Drosophila subobscura]
MENSQPEVPKPIPMYMEDNNVYKYLAMTPSHLSTIKLEQGVFVKLWMKTNGEKKLLAVLCESEPMATLDIQMDHKAQLYLECDGPSLVALVGYCPTFPMYRNIQSFFYCTPKEFS